ncbi:MAG: hypothetical protein KBF65_14355 [Rubrivivax sp.]|jgi:hypothetical protein|nr:hypothetical protein [Rubrivivax sp.]
MHLLIPFAAPLAEAGRHALATLSLPRLQALLARLGEVERDEGDEWCLSPPHERALARALGWQGGAGLLPWAARQAAATGVDVGELAWGLLTPTHWHLGTDQVSLLDPARLMLDEATSRALFDAMLPLFTGEGFVLRWGAPLRWYAAHESLATLATASLDRVIGRNVDAWLGSDPAARRIRRLQSEVQMLLHTHPLNAEREARGLLPVNSFWLSGCGVQQRSAAEPPQVDERLRAPALNDDWAAWARAWETLDEGPLAELLKRAEQGRPVRLTLCGERSGVAFEAAPQRWTQRLRSLWSAPRVRDILEPL